MEIIASEPMTVKKYTYDGFRKIELTNNLSCESYTASFNRIINRSADLKKLAQQLGCITTAGEDRKLTLKRLCTTRWSS
jgi:tagatose-1,6-bisphosphate aldolase non-catalytic subunit AgaZ/GatZ